MTTLQQLQQKKAQASIDRGFYAELMEQAKDKETRAQYERLLNHSVDTFFALCRMIEILDV